MSAPVRLDRLQRGLFEALRDELAPAVVSWGRMDAALAEVTPRWLSLQLLRGPAPDRWKRARSEVCQAISEVRITVPAPIEGQVAALKVNLGFYAHDVAAGEDAEAVRDALLAAAAAGESGWGVDAAADGADQLVLTPAVPGGLYYADAFGILAGEITYGDSALAVTRGQYLSTIEAQTFAKKGAGLVDSAQALAADALHSLQTDDVSQRLSDYWGVGIADKTPPQDLSAIAGAYWESRAQFTFQCRVQGAKARQLTPIETARLGITLDFPGQPRTITFDLDRGA